MNAPMKCPDAVAMKHIAMLFPSVYSLLLMTHRLIDSSLPASSSCHSPPLRSPASAVPSVVGSFRVERVYNSPLLPCALTQLEEILGSRSLQVT